MEESVIICLMWNVYDREYSYRRKKKYWKPLLIRWQSSQRERVFREYVFFWYCSVESVCWLLCWMRAAYKALQSLSISFLMSVCCAAMQLLLSLSACFKYVHCTTCILATMYMCIHQWLPSVAFIRLFLLAENAMKKCTKSSSTFFVVAFLRSCFCYSITIHSQHILAANNIIHIWYQIPMNCRRIKRCSHSQSS